VFVNRRSTLTQSGLKSDDEQTASHLQYFGMWGDSPAAGPNSTSAFTNLHLPYGCSTSLCSASEFPSKMFNLVPLRWLMWNCTTKPGQINGGLKTSWRDEWTAASAHYAPIIANNSAQGFMLGDELVWQGCTVEAVALLAEAVRADFPTAPIYYNENVPVVLHGRNGGGRAINFSLPEALTWFSFDYYHYDGKDDGAHVQTVRSVYQDHVYPKMKPHQRALLVPGAFDMPAGATIPGGFKCNTSCFDSMGADDAAHYWAWAQADDRVVGLAPWEWHDGGGRLGSWHMPQTRAAWETIGRKILSAACVKSDDNEGSASHVHLWTQFATESVSFDSLPPLDLANSVIDIAAQKGELERRVLNLRAFQGDAELTNIKIVSHIERVSAVNRSHKGITHTDTAPAISVYQQGFLFLNATDRHGGKASTALQAGWYADPLLKIPASGIPRVLPQHTQPMLLVVWVPRDAVPGQFVGKITVSGQQGTLSFQATVPITLTVWPITVPLLSDTNALPTLFNFQDNGVGYNDPSIGDCSAKRMSSCLYPKLEPLQVRAMRIKWYEFLASRRIAPTPGPSSENILPPEQAEDMVAAGAKYLYLRDVSTLALNNSAAVKECNNSAKQLCFSREYIKNMISIIGAQLQNLSRVHGKVTFIAYGFDEQMTNGPGPSVSFAMSQLFGSVKKQFPQVVTMSMGFGWQGTGTIPPLSLPLDVYVPLFCDDCWDHGDWSTDYVGPSDPGYSFCHVSGFNVDPPLVHPTASAGGKNKTVWKQSVANWKSNHSYWWYTANEPSGCLPTLRPDGLPTRACWLNFASIPWVPINGRLLMWLMAQRGDVEGFNYWCLNCWNLDAGPDAGDALGLRPLYRVNGTMFVKGVGVIGAGDGTLVYPGEDGPLPSIRLENLADGIDGASAN
jgi:hypothetical protein